MVLFLEKKPLRLLPAIYLVFAILGTGTFAMTDTFRFDLCDEYAPVTDEFFTSQDHRIDWLIENTALIGRAKGHSPSPLGNGTLRIFMPLGIQYPGPAKVQLSVQTIKKIPYLTVKNTILLKLRI
ncbi:MAG: hypothetical protein LBD55_07215 [Treponema sp.]|jgi:hypothetical protein|nr:hypothetical protein [Treponema sp.]